jgi:hypothetical protein
MKFFKMKEFTCTCGCGDNKMDFDFLIKLDYSRSLSKTPYRILRGYSCEKHPLTIKYPSSSHPKRCAVDIEYRDSSECWDIITSLIEGGFRRIGINNGGIHVDSDEDKPCELLWNYYPK